MIHAVEHALVVVDTDPDADPPKVLVIGPRTDGQLLEVIILSLANDRQLCDPRHGHPADILRPAPERRPLT